MTCSKSEDCEFYPQYGVAPHECYWRKPGGFDENPLGTSTVTPLADWPDNFLAEIDAEQDVAPQLSWGLCGVWYCPHCKEGMPSGDTGALWNRDRILASLTRSEGGE